MPDKKLTLKQRKWLKLYIESGNATQSAMAVYDCKDTETAANIGYENVRKLDIQQALEEAGLSTSKLLQVHREGLEANRVISAVNTDKNATGATSDFIEVPDHAVRHKFLETAYKLKKMVGPDSQINTQINVGDMTLEFSGAEE